MFENTTKIVSLVRIVPVDCRVSQRMIFDEKMTNIFSLKYT